MSKRKGICASSIRLEVTIPVRRPNIALSIVRRVPARKESLGSDKSLHSSTGVGPDNRNHRVFRPRTHAQNDLRGLPCPWTRNHGCAVRRHFTIRGELWPLGRHLPPTTDQSGASFPSHIRMPFRNVGISGNDGHWRRCAAK